MRISSTADEKGGCPKCGKIKDRILVGYNQSGTQRYKCKNCSIRYTFEPKQREYSEKTKKTCNKNVLFRRKRTKCRQNLGHE